MYNYRSREAYAGYAQDTMGNIQVSQGGGDPGPSTSQVNQASTGPHTPKRPRLGMERPELQPLQIDVKKVCKLFPYFFIKLAVMTR